MTVYDNMGHEWADLTNTNEEAARLSDLMDYNDYDFDSVWQGIQEVKRGKFYDIDFTYWGDFDKNNDLLVEEYNHAGETPMIDLGYKWVYMSDMQTPVPVFDKPLRGPRLFIGDLTVLQASNYINSKWQLDDQGFQFNLRGILFWKWW